MKKLMILMTFLGTLILIFGCSGGHRTPVSSNIDDPDIAGIPVNDQNPDNAQLWGTWNLDFDIENLDVTVVPDREMAAQYNITTLIPTPLIHVTSYNPVTKILDVDVTIENPYSINGYDVRGILYTNDAGLMMVNGDDWTGLFDKPGGYPINPFKAFAKNELKRIFTGHSSYAENYQIYYPNPPGTVSFAVTASFPGNISEPYSIDNLTQTRLFDYVGSTSWVEVDVLDWQDNAGPVFLMANTITGQQLTPMARKYGNTWGVQIANKTGATPGAYAVIIVAASANSGSVYLYDYLTLEIDDGNIPSSPSDITPDYLNFCPKDISIDGNYAYIAGSYNGFHIFDISDPANPVWVKKVAIPGDTSTVCAGGGYAYVTSGSQLHIIDVEPPAEASIVKTVTLGTYSCSDIFVTNGFAFIAENADGVKVVDVSPIDSAYFYSTAATSGDAKSVYVVGAYLYVASGAGGVDIFLTNIRGDEPTLIKNIPTTSPAVGIDWHNDYAYVAAGNLQIIFADPPESASVIKEVSVSGCTQKVTYDNGYVYAACDSLGVYVFDVDPPANASQVATVDTSGYARAIALSGDYAFAVAGEGGLVVINRNPPEFSHFVMGVPTAGYAQGVAYSDGYAYVGNTRGGFLIYDVDPQSSPNCVLSLEPNYRDMGVAIQDGFAFVVDGLFLRIVDVDPPESANYVGEVYVEGNGEDVVVQDGYAYVAVGTIGIKIVDIDPIDFPTVVKTVDTPGWALGADVQHGYLYVADHTAGLQILDIDPPESASIVHSVPTEMYAWDVAVQGNYAYVADHSMGLKIMDISTPETAFLVKSVALSATAYGVDVQSDYAYLAVAGGGLKVVDVNPPLDASVIASLPVPRGGYGVDVDGQYAYVTAYEGGLRIIKLW